MNAMPKIEDVVYCEGYHDRAFWTAWLTDLGAKSLKATPRETVSNPWGDSVRGGTFAFASRSGSFLSLTPVRGVTNTQRFANERLSLQQTQPARRIVVCTDSDLEQAVDPQTELKRARQQILDWVRSADPNAVLDAGGDVVTRDARVMAVRGCTSDPMSPALPAKQTLERLVCASIGAAYPQRAEAASAWLGGAPTGGGVQPHKAHAWSHMAGWYADHGCDDFWKVIWKDERTRTQLERRLREMGAWSIAERLVAGHG